MTTNGTDLSTMSDADVAKVLRDCTKSYDMWTDTDVLHHLSMMADGVRLAYKLGAAAVRAQAPSLLEAQREAYIECFRAYVSTASGEAERAADRRFPLPAPAGVTLSDDLAAHIETARQQASGPFEAAVVKALDALKAYAAEQAEAR